VQDERERGSGQIEVEEERNTTGGLDMLFSQG